LQGENSSALSDERTERLGDGVGVPELDGDQDQIDGKEV